MLATKKILSDDSYNIVFQSFDLNKTFLGRKADSYKYSDLTRDLNNDMISALINGKTDFTRSKLKDRIQLNGNFRKNGFISEFVELELDLEIFLENDPDWTIDSFMKKNNGERQITWCLFSRKIIGMKLDPKRVVSDSDNNAPIVSIKPMKPIKIIEKLTNDELLSCCIKCVLLFRTLGF